MAAEFGGSRRTAYIIGAKIQNGRFFFGFLISPPVFSTSQLGPMLAKLAALKAAIGEGSAGSVARGNVFGRVHKTFKHFRSPQKS